MAKGSAIRAGKAFVEIFADNTALAAGLRQARNQLRAFGASLQSTGVALLKLGGAAAIPLALATKTFAGFEREMSRVKALTGAAESEFESLNQKARELGKSTVFTAAEAAQAMSAFAQAGFKTNQIIAAMKPTLDLAAAGQIDVAEAAKITIGIMAGMGIGADDLGGAVDVLVKAMTTAKTDITQLGDAMKYVGPIAKTAGISFAEVTAAIQELSNAGIDAQLAGTSLRGILLTLTSPSKEAAKTMDELGITVLDATGKMLPLANIVDQFNAALAGLGGGAKLGVIGKIFDTRQAAGFAQVLAAGGNQLRAFTKTLQGATGTSSKIAAIQLDNIWGAAKIVISALQELQIVIGDALKTSIRKAADFVLNFINALSKWTDQNRQVVTTVAKVAAVVVATGATFLAASVAVKVLAFAFGVVPAAIAAASAALGVIGALLTGLLSPIGLVVAAIASFGIAIVKWTGAGAVALKWLGDRFAELKTFIAAIVAGISNALAAGDIALAAKVLWLGLKVAWLTGVEALKSIWGKFRDFMVKVAIDSFYGAAVILNNSIAAMERAWLGFVTWMGRKWADIKGDAASAWNILTLLAQKAGNEIKGAFDISFDTKTANAEAEKTFVQAQQAIERENAKRAQEIDADKAERLKAIEQDRATTESQLVAQANAAEAKRKADFSKSIAEAEAAVKGAKAELQSTLENARIDRALSDFFGPGLTGGGPPVDPSKVTDSISTGVEEAASQISKIARGTFNPAAIQSLQTMQSQPELKRITAEEIKANLKLEAIVKGIDKVADKLPAFA